MLISPSPRLQATKLIKVPAGSPIHSIISQTKVRSSADGVGISRCRDFELPFSAICAEVKLERVFVRCSGHELLQLVQVVGGGGLEKGSLKFNPFANLETSNCDLFKE